jgi:hypothetical protein
MSGLSSISGVRPSLPHFGVNAREIKPGQILYSVELGSSNAMVSPRRENEVACNAYFFIKTPPPRIVERKIQQASDREKKQIAPSGVGLPFVFSQMSFLLPVSWRKAVNPDFKPQDIQPFAPEGGFLHIFRPGKRTFYFGPDGDQPQFILSPPQWKKPLLDLASRATYFNEWPNSKRFTFKTQDEFIQQFRDQS